MNSCIKHIDFGRTGEGEWFCCNCHAPVPEKAKSGEESWQCPCGIGVYDHPVPYSDKFDKVTKIAGYLQDRFGTPEDPKVVTARQVQGWACSWNLNLFSGPKATIECGKCSTTFSCRLPLIDHPSVPCPRCHVLNQIPFIYSDEP